MERNKNSSKMTSIARRINMEFWLRQFSDFLLIDLVLLIAVFAAFFLWREGVVPEGQEVTDRYFTGTPFETLRYICLLYTSRCV